MASRLEDIVIAQVGPLLDESVKSLFGRKHLSRHDQRRRVVWIRAQGPIEEPRQAGGRLVQRQHANDPDYRVTSCATRVDTVEAHIFGETDEVLERVLDSVIAALCSIVTAGLEKGPVTWPTQEEGEGGETRRTEKAVVRFGIRMPVPLVVQQLTPLSSTDHTCGTLDDAGNFTPQPED